MRLIDLISGFHGFHYNYQLLFLIGFFRFFVLFLSFEHRNDILNLGQLAISTLSVHLKQLRSKTSKNKYAVEYFLKNSSEKYFSNWNRHKDDLFAKTLSKKLEQLVNYLYAFFQMKNHKNFKNACVVNTNVHSFEHSLTAFLIQMVSTFLYK